MTETLLSPSNVLLFGRVMADLRIQGLAVADHVVNLIATANIELDPYSGVDNVRPARQQRVLLSNQNNLFEIGIYTVRSRSEKDKKKWKLIPYLHPTDTPLNNNELIRVTIGDEANRGYWEVSIDANTGAPTFAKKDAPEQSRKNHNPFAGERMGANQLLHDQLLHVKEKEAIGCFARIYGFSFEGHYYDLPRPVLFLVHGAGEPATEARVKHVRNPSRAPGEPSLTGIAAADFEFADDIRVWSYDKADYTIRMDVDTGMFEQVLLDACFDGGGGGRVSGAMVSGAMVGGPSARGAMVRGAMVSGAMVRGRRGGRGDPSD